MKICVHCKTADLFSLRKLCIPIENMDNYLDVETFELIYLFSQVYEFVPRLAVNLNNMTKELEVVLRRQYYCLVCVIDNCNCLRIRSSLDVIKDVIYTGLSAITYENGFNWLQYTERNYISGFGVYVRSLIRQVCELYKHEVFHIHGSEFESVKAFEDLDNVVIYGLPSGDDIELLSKKDLVQKGISISDELDNMVVNDEISYISFSYEKVPAEKSYTLYKQHYPAQFDSFSIKIGFKYTTFKSILPWFKQMFKGGVVLLDVGCGNLYKFMLDENIKVSISQDETLSYFDSRLKVRNDVYNSILADPLWDDVSEDFDPIKYYGSKITGYSNKFFILPDKMYKDFRLKKVFKGNSICFYQFIYGMKAVESVDELNRRQFRSVVERFKIKRMDMFDDKSEAIKVALFSISNEKNFWRFKSSKRLRQPLLHGRQILGIISAEAYSYCKSISINSKRPWIQEYKGVRDYTVFNGEMYLMGLDVMSMKDFEVLVYPNHFKIAEPVYYNICDQKGYYYGIATNLLTSSIQNVVNSPSMNKSISTKLKISFKLDETDLHRKRFIAFKQICKYTDLRFHTEIETKDKKAWSLSYYIDKSSGKPRFIDVSGHVINLILASSIEIKNLRGYIRMKQGNLRMKNELSVSLLEDRFKDFANGEDRSPKNKIWHTYLEDVQACEVANILLKEFNLPNVDVSIFEMAFKNELVYPRNELSVSVERDKRLFSQ